ncbi:hypothetical protein [Dechloromonas sp. A34]|uniref:hypothetical protein n=1 Tax=Dechloromonas sp. A34 TaxID=447588 RepID=UPI002248AC02|nr:hypothetical protein [Dechloromonas sp. A34]
MKLSRLESTTQNHSPEAVERGHRLAGERIRRVEAMEGIEGDRQRSLQQEIAEVDPKAIGPFAGAGHVLEDARAVAAELTLLGTSASGLLKLRALSIPVEWIDDKA